MILLKNGTVYTMDEAGVFVGDVKFDQGKIVAVGKDLSADGCEVIDCTGKNIYPGFIDGHSHLGMQESSIRFEGDDVNEMSDPLTPHVRAIDALNPMDETIHNAACGGVSAGLFRGCLRRCYDGMFRAGQRECDRRNLCHLENEWTCD